MDCNYYTAILLVDALCQLWSPRPRKSWPYFPLDCARSGEYHEKSKRRG